MEMHSQMYNRETGASDAPGFGTREADTLHTHIAGDYIADENEQEDMATSEERLFILRMLEQGKIKADEAARLLGALDNGQATSSSTTEKRDPFDTAHGLRIRVQDIHTGKEQVNVNIPAGLVRFGLRFVPASAHVDVDAIQAAIESGSVGKIVEVADQDSGKRVQIFLE